MIAGKIHAACVLSDSDDGQGVVILEIQSSSTGRQNDLSSCLLEQTQILATNEEMHKPIFLILTPGNLLYQRAKASGFCLVHEEHWNQWLGNNPQWLLNNSKCVPLVWFNLNSSFSTQEPV